MFRLTILTLRNHQIIPYKRRLKIENMLPMLLFIFLINCSVSSCSIINGVRDSRVTYQSQSAKDMYLKSLQDTLRSQLQNISSIAETAAVVTSIDKVCNYYVVLHVSNALFTCLIHRQRMHSQLSACYITD